MSASKPADDARTALLRQRFSLESFRPWQREAVDGLLDGPGRVLVVAPTGGGKSLTYQFPAAVLGGLTVVISPLVALMEDQVRSLRARGIPASFLASTLDVGERRARERAALEGELSLLYCAPERLAASGFVELLERCRVSMVAVDEAHCIAQWGHDFRPDYLRIGELLERLRPARVLACTATATPRVREEIKHRLGLDGCLEIVRGFARENLHLAAQHVDGKRQARVMVVDALDKALGDRGKGAGSAIVYCATRRATEEATDELVREGFDAATYHAGLSADVRADVNARFGEGALRVVCATNAFGMGIDRADVRAVVHAQPPSSLEAYYQEVGRAGRDGQEAHGLLLCSASDVAIRRRLCESSGDGGSAPPEVAQRNWSMFRDVLRYLDAGSCRHDFILRYFGDEREVLGGCGHCDVCADLDAALGEDDELVDEAATEVRKALAGIARAKQRGGLIAVTEMLRGERTERVRRFGFDTLSTFGLLSGRSAGWIAALLRSLLAAGWIDLTPTDAPVPFITNLGARVMRDTGPVRLRLPREMSTSKLPKRERAASSKSPRAPDVAELSGAEAELFAALRAHRAEIARARKVPAYVVAQDATLLEIARQRPRTPEALLAVRGMGPFRVEAYGDGLLAVVRGG
jgi:ATP-dependent DNA helicase RecQ